MSMLISAMITHPQYECDVAKVLDHEHPGFFEGIFEVPEEFETLEAVAQEAVVIQLIREKLGICMLDGDLAEWSWWG